MFVGRALIELGDLEEEDLTIVPSLENSVLTSLLTSPERLDVCLVCSS